MISRQTSIIGSAVVIISAISSANASQKPTAVSLDYCADQYLLQLGDPGQIIALSRGADEPDSYLRHAAKDHHMIRASREEIAALKPDIVLRQWGGGARAQSDLAGRDIDIISIPHAVDFEDVRQSIRISARALDQTARGERLIAEMDQRLDAVRTRKKPAKRAIYITPGGVTAGTNTMISTMMSTAGLHNVSSDHGATGWAAFSLEYLVVDPPEMIITGFFDTGTETTNHWSAGRHPQFEKIFAQTQTVHLPADIISCAAWFAVDAVEHLAEAAR